MVLFLHNRYRTTGGEERVVEDLAWVVREYLHEGVEILARDSAGVGRGRAAAGLLAGGLGPREVADAVRGSGARVVHAHNLHPTLGWRALAAARGAGARTVLHLHQYRLVCAVGVCFTEGQECTRCHGRNTLPGVMRNCRGSRGESLAYGVALALWQRKLVEHADVVVVPSVFARERLRELGAPLDWARVRVLAPPIRGLGGAGLSSSGPAEGDQPASGQAGRDPSAGDAVEPRRSPDGYALVVSRLAREKGVDVAIEACGLAGVPLVIAGDGPERAALETQAAGSGVRFEGRVGDVRLAELRSGASVAVVPSRSAETFGLAAAEAGTAGLPVAASRVGALPELLDPEGLATAGDPRELARAIERLRSDPRAGERAYERVRDMCGPERVADELGELYGGPADPPISA